MKAVFWFACLIVITLAMPVTAFGAVYTDSFEDDNCDTSMWQPTIQGSGPTIYETNQRLEIVIPSTAQGNPTTGAFSAGYNSTRMLRGDFDMQVDYTLLTWPGSSGVRVGLGTSFGNVNRSSFGSAEDSPYWRQQYGSEISGAHLIDSQDGTNIEMAAWTNLTGKLRLTRAADVVTAYRWHNGSWIGFLAVSSMSTADTPFSLGVWSQNSYFTDKTVSVAFDNFIINSGQLLPPVPEPSSLAVLLMGLAAIGLRKRRR